MHHLRSITIAALIVLANGAWADLTVLDEPLWVFPGQTFRIALQQPVGSGELRAVYPDNVEMFDQWDQDDRQRYYFRALAPGDTRIEFSGRAGELTIEVQIIPWSEVYEPREYEGVQLPRLWPMDGDIEQLKPGRTIHTDDEIARLRESGRSPGEIARRWVEKSDQEIWDIIPGPDIPRTCLIVLGSQEPDRGVGKGCPVCGMDIYEGRSGFYPWLLDPDNHPWKVGCPECETWFPSNDWHEGDMTSGPFPDDGWGCEPLEPVSGESGEPWRWPFIAYYHQTQAYMRSFTPGILQSAEAYVITGDERYAHAAGVALARFAQAHLGMSLNLNQRKMVNRNGIYRGPVGAPIRGRFTTLASSFSYIQPNWDTPRMEDAMRAYDLIYDTISENEALAEFVRAQHHPEIETPADLHHFLHAGIIRTCAQYGIDNAVSRNWPMQERMIGTMALGLGSSQSMELVDYLLNDRPGLRYALTNMYLRDGAGYETGNYNRIKVRYMAGLGDLFGRIADLMPELYRPPVFVSPVEDPKFRQIYDFPLDASLIGRTTDDVGDASAPRTDPYPPRQGAPLTEGDFAQAFEWTGIERFAQAAWGPGGGVPDVITDPDVAAEIERIGREKGWMVDLESDVLDGYGHAILRSGEGDRQRAFWLRYGVAKQHRHWDMLTMGLDAIKRKFLPELGYPVGWTYAGAWENNWATHYGTHITGVRSAEFMIGSVQTFAASKPAQYARSRSDTRLDDPRPWRERAIALVDIDERDCYAVTIERVFGGEEHTWSFHGPSGPAEVSGVDLTPQDGGTIAGPDVPYRDMSYAPDGDSEMVSLAFMPDPMVGEATGPFEMSFELEGQDGVYLHSTHIPSADFRLWTAECEAPGGRSPYRATWSIMQRSGDGPLSSQFTTVLEPFEGERRVRSIEPIEVSGGAAGEFAPVALRVETDLFVDTIVIQPEGGHTITVEGGLQTDAEFALWRERRGELQSAVLVRGTSLRESDEGLTLSRPEYTGVIESCNWPERKILVRIDAPQEQRLRAEIADADGATLDAHFAGITPADASAVVGRMAHITNESGNRATHRIVAAQMREDGLELTLDKDARVAEGPVAEIEDGRVRSGVDFVLNIFGYYEGKTLANEDNSAWWRIEDVEGWTTPVIDTEHEGEVPEAVLREAFTDRAGDGVARMILYNYGPGDTVTIPCWAALSRRD